MENTYNIIIAGRSQIFREGMTSVLKKFSFSGQISEASDIDEISELIETNKPCIAIVDVRILLNDEDQVCPELVENVNGELKIIALGSIFDEIKLSRLMKSGISGFILKSIRKEELNSALLIIAEGGYYYSHEISNKVLNRIYTGNNARRRRNDNFRLTNRELEVLKLICDDMTNQEIGEVLFISSRTVDGHRANILNKLGVKSKVGIVKYALKHNIVSA
jgi:DNA-binding NarL/FixJ family response regulator